jgi:hypothetical protein
MTVTMRRSNNAANLTPQCPLLAPKDPLLHNTLPHLYSLIMQRTPLAAPKLFTARDNVGRPSLYLSQ